MKPVTGSENVTAIAKARVTGALASLLMATNGDVVSVSAVQLHVHPGEQRLKRVALRRVDAQPVRQRDRDDLLGEPATVPGRHPAGRVPVALLRPVHGRVSDREVQQVGCDVPAPIVTDSAVMGFGERHDARDSVPAVPSGSMSNAMHEYGVYTWP